MRINNKLFSLLVVLITCPVISGYMFLSEKEKGLMLVLAVLVFALSIFKLNRLLHFIIFLSAFFLVNLNSRLVFLNKIDFFILELFVLALLLFRKREPRPDIFFQSLLCLAAATFLIQFFTNRVVLGFYFNFWIDLKRHFPVFVFCIMYLIIRDNVFPGHLRKWAVYFLSIFILTSILAYLKPGQEKSIVSRKMEYNLAFFYRDRERWKDMDSSFRRGLVYQYLGLWPNARNEFKKILITSPEDVDAHFNLAISYEAGKFWYEAMSEFKKVIDINPVYPGSHYGLARSFIKSGDLDMAEKELLKEIELNPKEINTYIALEGIYKREGMIEKSDEIKKKRRGQVTLYIDRKDLSDDNMRILPVVLDGGTVTVEVVASGTYAAGFWPKMEVWMSAADRLVRGGDVWVRSKDWKSYYFSFKASPGSEKLIVHFINDFYGGPDNDRNLYIKRINFIYSK